MWLYISWFLACLSNKSHCESDKRHESSPEKICIDKICTWFSGAQESLVTQLLNSQLRTHTFVDLFNILRYPKKAFVRRKGIYWLKWIQRKPRRCILSIHGKKRLWTKKSIGFSGPGSRIEASPPLDLQALTIQIIEYSVCWFMHTKQTSAYKSGLQ